MSEKRAMKIFSDAVMKLYRAKWKIGKRELRENVNDFVVKSDVIYLDDGNIVWYLDGFSTTCNNGITDSFRIVMSNFSLISHQPNIMMRVQCTILDNDTKITYQEMSVFQKVNLKYPRYLILDSTLDALSLNENLQGELTIICLFSFMKGSSPPVIFNNIVPKVTEGNLMNDIKELFSEKKLTDVTFILGGKKIQAHKLILMARSPVFAAMFSHPMKEQMDNEVQIDDIDYEVFEEVLRYIYTDDVSNMKSPVAELLYAADKYELKYLKETYGASLGKIINIDNAAETFIVADRYNLPQLSEQTQSFISEHIKDFVKSSGYEQMVEKYPKLATKVFKFPALES